MTPWQLRNYRGGRVGGHPGLPLYSFQGHEANPILGGLGDEGTSYHRDIDPRLALAPVSRISELGGGLGGELGDVSSSRSMHERRPSTSLPPHAISRPQGTTKTTTKKHSSNPKPDSSTAKSSSSETKRRNLSAVSRTRLPTHARSRPRGITKTTTKKDSSNLKPASTTEKPSSSKTKRRNLSAVFRIQEFVNSEKRKGDLKHVFMNKGYDRKAASVLAQYEMGRLRDLVQ
jgi:hypothetical protein